MRPVTGLVLALMLTLSAAPSLAATHGRHDTRDAIREGIQDSFRNPWGDGFGVRGYLPTLPSPGLGLALVAFVTALLATQALYRQRLTTQRLRGEAERLQEALRHARYAPRPAPAPILAVRVRNGRRLVDPADIDLIRAADDYCELVLSKGDRLLHAATLEALARELPASFRRIHRSAIVNLDRIEVLRRRPTGSYEILTKSGEVLPVGRAYLAAARAIMEQR